MRSYMKDSFRISRLMSATPGCRLVARKELPRASPGLMVNESYGFADVFNANRCGLDAVLKPRRPPSPAKRGASADA